MVHQQEMQMLQIYAKMMMMMARFIVKYVCVMQVGIAYYNPWYNAIFYFKDTLVVVVVKHVWHVLIVQQVHKRNMDSLLQKYLVVIVTNK